MTQIDIGDPVNNEVHFLHSDNPRHGFCIMSMNPPTYYEFRTPIGFMETHTIVTDDSGATIVRFNWVASSILGTMTWPGPPSREVHMGEFVMPHQSMPDSRAFRCEGPDQTERLFWWRRLPQGNYDLYSAHGPTEVCIGLFRKHRPPEELIVGDNYATLYFRFLHGPLLLNALLALSLNRWLDFEDRPQF